MKKVQSGFTLIELMVSVALIGILASVILPGFQGFLAGQKVTGAANNFYNAAQSAKAEAIQRNGRVALVQASEGNSWCLVDRTLSSNTDCSATSNIMEDGVIKKFLEVPGATISIVKIPSTATEITYNSLGQIVANASGNPTLTDFQVADTSGSNKALNIQLTNGSIRLCNPHKASGDPQACN